jgi:serine protease Do
VEKNGPADKGGLEAGDVIIKFDGKPIVVSSDLPRAVGAAKPGKVVAAEVLRKGSSKTLNITVGDMPSDPSDVSPNSKPAAKPEPNRIGLIVKEATPQQKKKLNGKNGLIVIDAQGAVAQAGVRRGDVILGLNNTEVQNLEQFNKQLASFAAGKLVALLVLRGENTVYVPIKIPASK